MFNLLAHSFTAELLILGFVGHYKCGNNTMYMHVDLDHISESQGQQTVKLVSFIFQYTLIPEVELLLICCKYTGTRSI